jgi:hypothetical protein
MSPSQAVAMLGEMALGAAVGGLDLQRQAATAETFLLIGLGAALTDFGVDFRAGPLVFLEHDELCQWEQRASEASPQTDETCCIAKT